MPNEFSLTIVFRALKVRSGHQKSVPNRRADKMVCYIAVT